MTNGWIDIKNTDMMLIMGGNPAENHPCGFKWAVEAKIHRNAKTIVVDPRLTRTAANADMYVQICAGFDIAFLGGVIKYALGWFFYLPRLISPTCRCGMGFREAGDQPDDVVGGFQLLSEPHVGVVLGHGRGDVSGDAAGDDIACYLTRQVVEGPSQAMRRDTLGYLSPPECPVHGMAEAAPGQ